jgi:hypothetical protein
MLNPSRETRKKAAKTQMGKRSSSERMRKGRAVGWWMVGE